MNHEGFIAWKFGLYLEVQDIWYVDSNQGYNLYKWVICPQILGL